MTNRVGQQLGNYRLVALLGRGGQASVYLGEHVYLKSQAALKLLHAMLTDEERKAFLKEAQLLVRLAHPHIVRVLDFAVEDGTPFLVMEYAPGGTLRQRHPKGTRLSAETIVPYVQQVASALQYAHEQRLVHRDVKPENMLLGSRDEVLLSDFGLALFAPQTLSSGGTEPMEQSLAGTTSYLAPEQLRGQAQPASDQYALGGVVYEWLCSKPPFGGAFLEVAVQHVSVPPPSLREQVPTLSAAIEEVVLRALAKEPELRFACVQDFATALEHASKPAVSPRFTPVLTQEHGIESGHRQSSMRQPPTGTVTLLFTDIEGSTHLLQQVGEGYSRVLNECQHLLRASFHQWHGHEVGTQGDAFFVAFARATDALWAAVDAQHALAAHAWPDGVTVRVRMGLHTGEPALTSEGYVGLDVHRAARIMSAGYGGQVLLSQTTYNLVEHDLPDAVSLRDLGEHRLKDLQRPSHLYQLVISGLPADFPPVKTLDIQPHNLPIQPTLLIGRGQEVATVQHLLRREDVRLLTLTGPGGIGKTRLGLQVAAELSELFPDGVYFVNLAPLSDPALVVPTIARTLGVKEITDQPLLDLLKAYLREKQLLLLLDNFEQVVSAAVQVAALPTVCPKLKVLVTSRMVLHVQVEHEFAVPPLAVPDPKRLPDLVALSQYEAVALFLSRAQAVKPEFQLTTTNAPAVAEMCASLDGLPLAIELAAARIKLLPPQALLARLGHRLEILTSGTQDVPARQQTLRNTIAWSYQLLDAQEQQLFRRLSVFIVGCTLEAVEAVCAALDKGNQAIPMLDQVASLIDKSLLQQTEQELALHPDRSCFPYIDKSLLQQTEQEGEEPRFMMLETIREYGLEALTTSGELELTQEAHALCYLALAEQAESHFKGAQQGRWFARLEQEHENLRAALTFLLERAHMEVQAEEKREHAEQALRLCAALFWFWYECMYYREGWSFLERALAMRKGVDVSLQARVLRNAGELLWQLDDTERAEVLIGESLTLYRELGDAVGEAGSLFLLGRVALQRSQYALVRAHLEEAKALFQQVGDTWNRGRCLTDLARMTTSQGKYGRALALLEESLGLYQALGDQPRIGNVLYLLACVLFVSQSDLARAAALAEQSLALDREVATKLCTADPLRLLGEIRLVQGEQTRARELAKESVAIFREVGSGWDTAVALISLARVVACQGDHAAARDLYQESLALLNKAGDKESIATCLEGLGAVVTTQGTVEAPLAGVRWAVQLWGAAETLRQDIGTPLPPVYRADYEQAVTAAHSALGEKAFAAALAEGRTMTPKLALASQGREMMPKTVPGGQPPTPPAKSPPTYPAGLTAREVEVLCLVAQGLTDAQVAEQLVISPRTVNGHLRSIYNKINVTSRSAATRYAVDQNLV